MLMASGSVDQKNTYVFEVMPRGVSESVAKSLSYWSTGNGNDTMVTLWNPADEAQDFVFTLFYTGGHYGYPIHLGPRATQTFNISEIIHNQIPDAEGNVVPAGVQEGSAKISGSQAENEQILVAMDAGLYNVQKATCGTTCNNCDGFVQLTIVASPFTVAVGGNTQQTLTVQYNTGSQYDYTNQSNWSSSNTSVATVNAGLVNGVSPATVIITGVLANPIPVNTDICGEPPPNCPAAYATPSGQVAGTSTSVTFSAISYVLVGQTASTTATVSSGNSTPISLTVTAPAAVVSPTGTFTANTSVVVKGLTVGTATLTATVPNPEGGSPISVGSTSFPVTSAAPTAAVTQRTSGTVSTDDAASSNYQNLEGTTNLGPIIGSGALTGCFMGSEDVGTITPTNYTGSVILHRFIVQQSNYINSGSAGGGVTNQDDTANSIYRDDDPQSGGSNGKVYDLDAPGLNPPNVDGNTYRSRFNFYAYAALPDGTKISTNFNFYVRLSCTKTASGYQFVNDVPGDNQIGPGTTALTWNLQ